MVIWVEQGGRFYTNNFLFHGSWLPIKIDAKPQSRGATQLSNWWNNIIKKRLNWKGTLTFVLRRIILYQNYNLRTILLLPLKKLVRHSWSAYLWFVRIYEILITNYLQCLHLDLWQQRLFWHKKWKRGSTRYLATIKDFLVFFALKLRTKVSLSLKKRDEKTQNFLSQCGPSAKVVNTFVKRLCTKRLRARQRRKLSLISVPFLEDEGL